MSDALAEFRKFVDMIEARAMACDGPVTPFLEQLEAASDAEKERFTAILAKIYQSNPATEAQINHMVTRFLGWKLPETFRPDGGISFKKTFNEHTDHPMKHEPSGTNLLDAGQAEAMIRYMLDGIPAPETLADEPHTCPICEKPFAADDICATDITEGTCHAECLAGSPVVDLDTGTPLPEGELSTFRYGDDDPPANPHVQGWRSMSDAPRDGTHILAVLYRSASDDIDGRRWPAFSEMREIWFRPYRQFEMDLPWHAGDPFEEPSELGSEHMGDGVPIAWQPLPALDIRALATAAEASANGK